MCQAVPCYIKGKIDNMYTGANVMYAFSDGQSYTFDLEKQCSKTCITGHGWKKFVADYKMETDDKLLFELNSSAAFPVKLTPSDAMCKNKERSNVEQGQPEEHVSEEGFASAIFFFVCIWISFYLFLLTFDCLLLGSSAEA